MTLSAKIIKLWKDDTFAYLAARIGDVEFNGQTPLTKDVKDEEGTSMLAKTDDDVKDEEGTSSVAKTDDELKDDLLADVKAQYDAQNPPRIPLSLSGLTGTVSL